MTPLTSIELEALANMPGMLMTHGTMLLIGIWLGLLLARLTR